VTIGITQISVPPTPGHVLWRLLEFHPAVLESAAGGVKILDFDVEPDAFMLGHRTLTFALV